MVRHNLPCSAGAGCCGTVLFSPQRPSCHVRFEKDTHFLFRFTREEENIMKASEGPMCWFFIDML